MCKKVKTIESRYHEDVQRSQQEVYVNFRKDPRLYFDAFAIKVNPLMRSTQKTYKSRGGLVVDMFKPIRYN